MTTLTNIINILRQHKARLIAAYGIKDIAIFGSYGRGQQHEASDVDILVDFQKPIGIEFIDLADELENILHQKVDLVSKKGVRQSYLEQIEQELNYV